MVFTVGTLFEAGLLLINAIAILNEERFLQKGMSSFRLKCGVENAAKCGIFLINAH